MAVQDIPVPYAVRKYFYQKAAVTRSPLSGNFELTPRCNMDCKMCYIRMSPEEMISRGRERTAEEWIDLGKACAERGMLFLLLTGGEPFLRPDFREIYTELKKLGLLISINTNGTLLDEQTVQWLSADAPMKVNVTVYGGSNDTYRRLCGHSNGFDAMKQGVERLRQAGIFVNLNASFTNYNVEDIAAIGEFGREQGIPVTAATYMFPPVRSAREGKCDTAVRFAPEEAGLARARTDIEFLPEQVLKRKLKNLHSNCPLLSSTEECERCADEKMGCMAGKASFWVTWDGWLTPCGMMPEPKVDILSKSFADCWQALTELSAALRLSGLCETCSSRNICHPCAAIAMAETGTTEGVPRYKCRITQAISEIAKKTLDETT